MSDFDQAQHPRGNALNDGQFAEKTQSKPEATLSAGTFKKAVRGDGSSVESAGLAEAAHYLEVRGFEILARDWTCDLGTVSLVARKGDETVFAVVKSRPSMSFGAPLEAITVRAIASVRRVAGRWCEQSPLPAGGRMRIDAIGVVAPYGSTEIDHVERVF